MNTPHEVLTAEMRIAGHYHDSHIARKYAAEAIAHELARKIMGKAFAEPTIIKFDLQESGHTFICPDLTIRGRLRYVSFVQWANDHLCAKSDAEFGRILEIPLSDQRMMTRFENAYYVK